MTDDSRTSPATRPLRRRRPVRRLPHRRLPLHPPRRPRRPPARRRGHRRQRRVLRRAREPAEARARRVRPRALRAQGQDHGRLGDPPPPRRRRRRAAPHRRGPRLGPRPPRRARRGPRARRRHRALPRQLPAGGLRRGGLAARLPVPRGPPRAGREVDDARTPYGRRRPRGQRLRRRRGAALHPPPGQPAPRRRHRPPAGSRRGRPGPGMARRARHVRPGGAGERRPGRGRLRPLLLPGHQHHPAGPLRARWTTAGRPAAGATRATTGSATGWPSSRRSAPSRSTPRYLKGNAAGWAALSVTRRRATASGRRSCPAPGSSPTRTTASSCRSPCAPRTSGSTSSRTAASPGCGCFGSLTEEGAARLTARHEALGG